MNKNRPRKKASDEGISAEIKTTTRSGPSQPESSGPIVPPAPSAVSRPVTDIFAAEIKQAFANARDAADHGAVIRTRAKVVMARRHDGHWAITVEDQATGRRDVVLARALVNVPAKAARGAAARRPGPAFPRGRGPDRFPEAKTPQSSRIPSEA